MKPLRRWRTLTSEDNRLTVYLHFLTPTLVKLAGPARAWSLELTYPPDERWLNLVTLINFEPNI
jgi:hypothetical protein